MGEELVGQWVGDLRGSVVGSIYMEVGRSDGEFPASLTLTQQNGGGTLKFGGSLRVHEGRLVIDLAPRQDEDIKVNVRIVVDSINEPRVAGRWSATSGEEGVIYFLRADTFGAHPVSQQANQAPPVIEISPLSRINISFERELSLDKSGVFGDDRYQGYLKMLEQAEVKRDKILKSVLILDGIAILLLLGKAIKIPGTELNLNELPGALEAVTATAAFGFYFFVTTMLNHNAYSLIIDQFNVRKGLQSYIDPDFLSASDKYTEWAVKVFRTDFNLYGPDFFSPRWPFKVLSCLVSKSMLLVMLCALFVHLGVVVAACRTILLAEYSIYIRVSMVAFIGVTILCAVIVLLTMTKSFKFDVGKPGAA